MFSTKRVENARRELFLAVRSRGIPHHALFVVKLVLQKQRGVPLKRDRFVLITHLLITERNVVQKLY